METRWSLDKVRNNGPFPPDDLSDSPLSMRGDDGEGAARFGPYKKLHRLMRGRYHLLLPLLAIAMVGGGVYGWRRSKPVYRSEGLVQVANSLPKVLAPTDQNEPLDMFEEFVQAQVVLMTSRGVIASAIEAPNFKAALGKRHDINVDTFTINLLVEHPSRTQAINVTYTDPDPNVASQAVQALLAEFMRVAGKTGDAEQDRRLKVLDDRRKELSDKIDAIRKQLAQVQAPSLLSVAMVDDMMRTLLQEQTTLEGQLDDYLASGFGDGRIQVKNARQRLAEVNAQIDAYMRDVMTMQAATAATPQADRRVAMLPGFLGYQEKIDTLRTEREQIDQRIALLTTESSLGAGRFRIMTDGETPDTPYADHRPRAAAFYSVAAGSIPFMLFVLLGIADRRFRFSEDAVDVAQQAPLLGVLPELPKVEGYADLSRIAAYCVHNLRIRLQLLPGKPNDRIYMITSAAAGEGKTSLTMALGFSFAAAGKRVLLVDSDLVGRGLTNRLKCEGLPGLVEAVNGAGLSPIRSVMKHVSILPAGNSPAYGHAAVLPQEELLQVMNAARTRFDLIIIDTGPVVASLETPIVAQVADHVIMTISQGLQQVLSQRSMQILKSMGVKVTGVVFNRAREKDYRRWIGGDAYYASSASSQWNAVPAGKPAEYGPLAGSISQAVPVPTNGDHG